jgi:hypothetical protein
LLFFFKGGIRCVKPELGPDVARTSLRPNLSTSHAPLKTKLRRIDTQVMHYFFLFKNEANAACASSDFKRSLKCAHS